MNNTNDFQQAIKSLFSIANNLDEQGNLKLADALDKIANNLVMIKKAQYVGIQGYWIRNSRCWGNCYRQKRAADKSKPAQVIWQDCQNEYVESINNPESGWEKYADEKQKEIVKLGSAEKKIIETEKELFIEGMNKKLAETNNVGASVYSTIDENMKKYFDFAADEVEKLNKIAGIVGKKNIKLAEALNDISGKIVEAGMFDFLGRAGRAVGRFFDPTAAGRAKNLLLGLQGFISKNPNIQEMIKRVNATEPQLVATMKGIQGSEPVLAAIAAMKTMTDKAQASQVVANFNKAVATFLPLMEQQAQQAKAQKAQNPGTAPGTMGQPNIPPVNTGVSNTEMSQLWSQIKNDPKLVALLKQKMASSFGQKIKIAATSAEIKQNAVEKLLAMPGGKEFAKKMMAEDPTTFPPVAKTPSKTETTAPVATENADAAGILNKADAALGTGTPETAEGTAKPEKPAAISVQQIVEAIKTMDKKELTLVRKALQDRVEPRKTKSSAELPTAAQPQPTSAEVLNMEGTNVASLPPAAPAESEEKQAHASTKQYLNRLGIKIS